MKSAPTARFTLGLAAGFLAALGAVWLATPSPSAFAEPPATQAASTRSAATATPETLPASRQAVYDEMTAMFGGVPSFFKLVPDSSLALEWELFKRVQFDPGPIPNKYRELIGLGISSITHCQYCVAYHTEIARLNGASDAELEDAVHYAKSSAGWSTYLNGMQVDLAQFKEEVRGAAAYARAQAAKAATAPADAAKGKS